MEVEFNEYVEIYDNTMSLKIEFSEDKKHLIPLFITGIAERTRKVKTHVIGLNVFLETKKVGHIFDAGRFMQTLIHEDTFKPCDCSKMRAQCDGVCFY